MVSSYENILRIVSGLGQIYPPTLASNGEVASYLQRTFSTGYKEQGHG